MQINEFSNKDIDRMISKYNNEKISKILNLIDDKEKEVFTLYYGINCPKQSKKAIAAKLNITTGELNEILDNVYSTIEQIYPNDFSSIKNLFYSEFTGYSKEDVDKELAKIDDIHRQVLEKYFALKGDKIPTKHIIEEYKLRSGIEYYLKSGIALIIKKLENRPIPLDSFKQKFYQIFKEYSLEEITMAFNKLDDTQKNILSFYYALNGEKMTSKKIATKYNLKDEFEAISIIRKSMGVIKRQLDNKKLAEKYRKEFYQLFEEFKEEQIDDALSQIDENSRNVINAYYGLKGEKMTPKEIANKYSYASYNATYYVKKSLENLKNYLINKYTPAISDTTDCYKEKFYQNFDGFTQEEVDKALKKLDPERKKILSLMFGLNDDKLTARQIKQKYNFNSEINVFYYVNKSIELIKKHLYGTREEVELDFYENFPNFSKEEVDEALSQLESKAKNIIISYYGLDGEKLTNKEICEKYKISSVKHYLNRNIKLINMKLSDSQESETKEIVEKYQKKFYDYFQNRSKEEIDAALMSLDDETKDIIIDYYGLNNVKVRPVDIAVKNEIDASHIRYYLEKGIRKIKKFLGDTYFEKNFYQNFLEYTQEEVDKALLEIDEKSRDILISYFGINGDKIEVAKIAKKHSFKVKNIEANVERSLNALDKVLKQFNEIPLDVKFYQNFACYSKEEVDESLEKIDEKVSDILIRYYGLRGEKERSGDIAKKHNFARKNINYYLEKGIREIKKNLEKKDGDLEPSISDTKKIIEATPSEADIEKKEKFYESFAAYSREEIDNALSRIDEKRKGILMQYFGLKSPRQRTVDIANEYDFSVTSISYYIETSMNRVRKELEADSKANWDSFCEMFKGDSQEDIKDVFAKLETQTREMISFKYGLYCQKMTDEEIAQKYGLDCNKVSYIIEKNGIEMIRMYLANFRKAKITSESLKFYSKFNEYDREQVDQAIDKLSDNYQVVIKEYFGLDGEKLSSKEIMAKHKISHLSSYINRIILTISKMLDMSYIKEYQEKFYEKFKNYSKKEVYAALTKIDYPANEIIKLYYGLDGYRLKPSQIIEKFDISEALMRNYIYNAIKLVTNKLDVTIASSATQNKNNHQEKFYKIFGSHSKVEIDKILFSLDDELKKILISHYGLNGCDKCTTEVLSQQFGYSRGQLNFILKKGINSIKRQLLISKINDTSSENLINVMNKMFFDDINISDINQLKEAMAALDKKELNLIMIYYGLDSKHFMNLSNLSKAFKTTEEKIIAKVENIIFKLNNYNKENKKQI